MALLRPRLTLPAPGQVSPLPLGTDLVLQMPSLLGAPWEPRGKSPLSSRQSKGKPGLPSLIFLATPCSLSSVHVAGLQEGECFLRRNQSQAVRFKPSTPRAW